MKWYERFGIERPFPWLLIAICAAPVLVALGAISVGVLW